MARKKLEEMNLLDNFLFGSLVTHPEFGVPFTQMLLRIIFSRDFDSLSVFPQKVFYGSDSDAHGTRLDVYIEENVVDGQIMEQASVYDVEPDQKSGEEDIRSLPRRVRFYHAKIDSKCLRAGEAYEKLKNVIVIMITPFDPFGMKRMVYTIKNQCIEAPEMQYEDGARTLFLYTKGTEGHYTQALQELLRYMEQSISPNVVNKDLKELHSMVEAVRQDAEVTVQYMRMMEDEERLLKQGRKEGREEGRDLQLISQIIQKLKKGKSVQEIVDDLEEELSVIEMICHIARDFEPDYACEQIYEQMRKRQQQ